MSEAKQDHDLAPVRARLHELAAPVAADIRRARRRRAALEATDATRWSWLVVPTAYLALVAATMMAGADGRLAWFVLVPLWLLVPAGVVLHRALRRGRNRISDIGALAELDRELALADRLSAAREFVDAREPDAFMQAAIRDAERRIDQARGTRPDAADTAPRLRATFLAWAALGIVVMWAAGSWAGTARDDGPPPEGPQQVASVPDAGAEPTRDPEPAKAQAHQPAQRNTPEPSEPQAGDESAGDDSDPSQQTRRGRNPQGAGRSAQARTSAGGGSERGQPSNQAQGTKGQDSSKPKAKKPKKPKADAERKHEAPKKPPEQSGATQGRGSGRGSSRSPMATPWASKDQVVSDEQEELEEDEEVEDENDESEARGGLQPNLRQRKPPVNRDLQIAMGGGPPDDDANGRGGPGGPKKQRGVAQLVLGVTFPDHVTSPPNPGMSKVTQERIEPQAQQPDEVTGEDRGRRAAPMGHLPHRVLSPWMQDLVREFYLSIRDTSRTE